MTPGDYLLELLDRAAEDARDHAEPTCHEDAEHAAARRKAREWLEAERRRHDHAGDLA